MMLNKLGMRRCEEREPGSFPQSVVTLWKSKELQQGHSVLIKGFSASKRAYLQRSCEILVDSFWNYLECVIL